MVNLWQILEGKEAALFDLDGVILDTESQYSSFWKKMGERYYPEIPSFADEVKGRTLTEICRLFFDHTPYKETVVAEQAIFQDNIKFFFINGAEPFVKKVREMGLKTAIVTSSDATKMNCVYRTYPEFKTLFDKILTEEDFSASKPNPDCYLRAAERLNAAIDRCVVFEDSRNGLMAGRNAKMTVVGLATTLSKAEVEQLADYTIDDFSAWVE